VSNSDNGKLIRRFDSLNSDDTPIVGGKNASLGEMIQNLKERGIRVPDGFATTAEAYWHFIDENDLREKIAEQVERLDGSDKTLRSVGKKIRRLILEARIPDDLADSVRSAYAELSKQYDDDDVDVAVRSSATAEDLPEASFAGQLESFLNVSGPDDLLDAVRQCYASLFTDRGISYREENDFDHLKIALSAGVQKMARSGEKEGSAGVMFTIDTETGFPDVVVINAAWGLGESVVAGRVDPDEYRVFKPMLEDENLRPIIRKRRGSKETRILYGGKEGRTQELDTPRRLRRRVVLSDEDILTLARWARAIEDHYERPMDVEWAKEGDTGDIYIVQARPETVQSQKTARKVHSFKLKERGERLLTGTAVGSQIAAGKAFVLDSPDEAGDFEDGGILVTAMTNPDWGPVLARAGGVVTDAGGRTSHAAIVSREMGVPAIVGCSDATDKLKKGQEITVSCAEGEEGIVYDGLLEFDEKEIDASDLPETKTRIMTILASPNAAFRWWALPTRGVGLARMEFIINNAIKAHPLALTRFDDLEDKKVKKQIDELTAGYDDRREYFVDQLAQGIGSIAASAYPHPAIVRLSDFKTNEYADLIGGEQFEPAEANPMLGFRGASRYYSDRYRDGFELECAAIRRVRREMGLRNLVVMVPFCRTVAEADRVLEVMADNGLERGQEDLKVYVMAEIPANIVLADEFAERFDGFSIGSNDLTQLVLGVDRDNQALSELFDERNEAVKRMISHLIETAHAHDTEVGICGQAPSDHPEFGKFLVEAGIDTISVNPDSVVDIIHQVAEAEKG
jgi:pyruvate,water dikinase